MPVHQSQAIYDAAPNPKRWVVVEGADHNDARFSGGPELIDAITQFLAEVNL